MPFVDPMRGLGSRQHNRFRQPKSLAKKLKFLVQIFITAHAIDGHLASNRVNVDAPLGQIARRWRPNKLAERWLPFGLAAPGIERNHPIPGIPLETELEVAAPNVIAHEHFHFAGWNVIVEPLSLHPEQGNHPIAAGVFAQRREVILRSTMAQVRPQRFIAGRNGRNDIVRSAEFRQRNLQARAGRLVRLQKDELMLVRKNHRPNIPTRSVSEE